VSCPTWPIGPAEIGRGLFQKVSSGNRQSVPNLGTQGLQLLPETGQVSLEGLCLIFIMGEQAPELRGKLAFGGEGIGRVGEN